MDPKFENTANEYIHRSFVEAIEASTKKLSGTTRWVHPDTGDLVPLSREEKAYFERRLTEASSLFAGVAHNLFRFHVEDDPAVH